VAGKTRKASRKKIVNLEAIEDHLDREDEKFELHDKKTGQSLWWSFAALGIPIMLVGTTLNTQNEDVARIMGVILFYFGVAVILGGVLGIVKPWRLNFGSIKKNEKLNQRGKKMKPSIWLTIGAPVGFSVFLTGWMGFVQVLIVNNPNVPVGC